MSLLAIVGPTASGKTQRAVEAALAFNGEIISADSRQVYTGMDIGSGKDLNEYGSVRYHLIDIAPAGSVYNLYRYLHDARHAIDSVRAHNKLPIVCGGTGMYVESLLRGVQLAQVPQNAQLRARLQSLSLDELRQHLASLKTLHNTTDTDTHQRAIRAIEIATYYIEHPELATASTNPHPIDAHTVVVGIDIDRETRRQRIETRLHQRLAEGMIEEVDNLLSSGVDPERLVAYGLEYKFLTLYLQKQISYDEMVSQLLIAIHQFAKRQMTWFRGMERRGTTINWINHDASASEFISFVESLLNRK